MFSFVEIEKINIGFKSLLEDSFKLVYIEKKETKKEKNKEYSQDDLSPFKIERNRESIFERITSIDKLNEVKKDIIDKYDNFSDDYLDFFDRAESQGQLEDKQIKSFEIIDKIIKNRGKKLKGNINKFNIEDSWTTSKIKEEFYFKLQKNLNDIVDSLIPAISTGMRESSAYKGVLTSLNNFLSQLGIYTMDLKTGEVCNYEFIAPQDCDDCETEDESKKDIVKEILSYPYILSEEEIVVEGKVILWKVKHNG